MARANEWAPVHGGISGALGFFVSAKSMSGLCQFKLRIDQARGLCAFNPAATFKLSAA